MKDRWPDIALYAACLVFAACLPLRAANVEWNQKGRAWSDPANWSTGKAPGPDDIAVFNSSGAITKPADGQWYGAGGRNCAGRGSFQREVYAANLGISWQLWGG